MLDSFNSEYDEGLNIFIFVLSRVIFVYNHILAKVSGTSSRGNIKS